MGEEPNTLNQSGCMTSQIKQHVHLLRGGKQYFEPPVHPQAFMVDDVLTEESSEKFLQAPYDDIRNLVRLLQCPCCSKLFTSPVTLPCSHTVCRACLPAPQPRANISYPNTPDRLIGVACPLSHCGTEHAAAECSTDVTMSKLMDLFKAEISDNTPTDEDSPMVLETIVREVLNEEFDTPMEEKNAMLEQSDSRVLHGGRLASTFTLAQSGELPYRSELKYHSLSASHDDYEDLDVAMLRQMREITQKELECLVCYSMMLDPTTTCCGHTFCRGCLVRVMDHNSICPVCRRDLHLPASLQNKSSNTLLNSLLNTLCPDLVAARRQAVEMEAQAGSDELDVPLFICTLSLPTMPTFLHVFEPRYRLMIRRCVESGNRQFGMVMYNKTNAPQGDLGVTQFLEYGTLLEIVNYELLRDGRSFVETRGVGRFKIRAHSMLDGYSVARIERVEDISLGDEGAHEQRETTVARELADEFEHANPGVPLPGPVLLNLNSTQDLLDKCMIFIREMRQASAPWLSSRIVQVYGEPPQDPAIFPYWFASVLPIADEEKYVLLRTTRVRERLMIVYSWIERIRGHRW